jgi:glycerophosphoryl diester phosphodiesterase
MKKIFLLIIVSLVIFSACNKDKKKITLHDELSSFLKDTYPIPEIAKTQLEGIYTLSEGNDKFGSNVVVRWTRDKMSVFSGTGCYMILNGGFLDSVFFFEGYWRNPFNYETGYVELYISKEQGGIFLHGGTSASQSIKIKGGYASSGTVIDKPFIIDYSRPFSDYAKNSNFEIIAHRSGGRTSDALPFSENSIPMIKNSEYFGSTGIEIDIRMTKDGVPILYHDPDINIRLTKKGPLSGPVENFTYNQLYYFVQLINGEKIPKLEDALDALIDSTTLRFIWFDIKVNSDQLATIIAIQKAALEKAAAKGRNLTILAGIPSVAVLNDFMQLPDYANIPSLCELSLDDVRNVNARAWGPRWTEGMQTESVLAVQNEGRKAYCWTIDDINFIQQYINEGSFDGLLSNYPYLIAYYHYVR